MSTQDSEVEIRAIIIKRTAQLHNGAVPLLSAKELSNLDDAYEIAKREVELKLPIPVGIVRKGEIIEAKDVYFD